jgi:two-component sensor histidine kinase
MGGLPFTIPCLGDVQAFHGENLMSNKLLEHRVALLLRREKALASFGTFAFREIDLQPILDEAAKVCAECMGVSYSKICKYRPAENDLRVVSGFGWNMGVVGFATSVADESSPQGRAFTTGEPQLCANIKSANTYYSLPQFYQDHKVLSTLDVLVAAKTGPPFGVFEIDSQEIDAFDEHDIDFLTGFANVLAEAVATTSRAEQLRKTIIRMEELVDEKETLSQELKHRVRNSLHIVYGLLTTELDGDHNEASIIAFRSIALRVMGLAQVFDHLLGIGMHKIINFGDYVSALCVNLPDLYATIGASITLNCMVQAVQVDLDEATALGIIITELVNNAYLHAFPNGEGVISVALRVTPSGTLLTIADNGIGFVPHIETKRRGMGLVRRLVAQVDATLTLQSDHGSIWTVRLADRAAAPLAA